MQDVEYLDGLGLYRWVRSAVGELTARRTEINALNVFPVPDADTGSNMAHTMTEALKEIETLDPEERCDVARVSAAMATGSVRGARGNSGVVLSQVLRGLAQSAAQGQLNGRSIQKALNMGNGFVVRAINEPVEGTVITVLRAAAIAANQAANDSLVEVLGAATHAAQVALDKTPSQLAVLREAGVVDAGAKGLVVLLESLLRAVGDQQLDDDSLSSQADETPQLVAADLGAASVALLGRLMGAKFIGHYYPKPMAVSPFGQPQLLAQLYTGSLEAAAPQNAQSAANKSPLTTNAAMTEQLEVMFFIENANLDKLRESLIPLGDSFILAAAGDESGTIHIHTTQPEKIVEIAYAHGDVSQLHFEVLPRQLAANPIRQLVVLSPTGKIADHYQATGALVLTRSTDSDVVVDIMTQARGKAVAELIVLPNGYLSPYELASVEQSGRAFEQNIAFVPTAGLLPSLQALKNHDGSQPVAVDAYLMTQAATRNNCMLIKQYETEYVGWLEGVTTIRSVDLAVAVYAALVMLVNDNGFDGQVAVVVDSSFITQVSVPKLHELAKADSKNRISVREKVCIIIVPDLHETTQGTVAEVGVI